jgi:photosystem II stability/assembly factor-like uncharacterized protein
MTVSRDGGHTFLGNEAPLPRNTYVRGIAVLDASTLLVATSEALYQSDDGGCSYRAIASLSGIDLPPSITAAGAARAYVWSRQTLLRWDRGSITLLLLPGQIAAVGARGDEVRIAGVFGAMWESHDAGGTWSRRGAVENVFTYDAAWDPNDFDHVVRSTRGIQVSRDGGATWTESASPSNIVYDLAFSSDGIWAAAYEGILHSTDGGASFALAAATNVAHDNGILVADGARIYWMWGDELHTLDGLVAKISGLERFDVAGGVVYAARSEHVIVN